MKVRIMWRKRKRKRILRLLILHEILETLVTICNHEMLESRRRGEIVYDRHFHMHSELLKDYANELHDEIKEEPEVKWQMKNMTEDW